MTFEKTVVLEQLCYTGMLETIRIRKLGYPVRYKFYQFIQKYRTLIGKKNTNDIDKQKTFITEFLTQIEPGFHSTYQMGITKVITLDKL